MSETGTRIGTQKLVPIERWAELMEELAELRGFKLAIVTGKFDPPSAAGREEARRPEEDGEDAWPPSEKECAALLGRLEAWSACLQSSTEGVLLRADFGAVDLTDLRCAAEGQILPDRLDREFVRWLRIYFGNQSPCFLEDRP